VNQVETAGERGRRPASSKVLQDTRAWRLAHGWQSRGSYE
jgi:hypothetical protein